LLADPLTITIGSTPGATSVARVSTGNGNSQYLSADGLVRVGLSSSYGKRTRRVARVDITKIAADPFIPSTNAELSSSVYVVFDHPKVGFSVAEMVDLFGGISTLLSASSNSNATKLLGGQS